MSVIYPNNFGPPNNVNIPYINICMRMKALTSELIQSRIIQKNLVYLIGLSSELIQIENKLKSFEYFGQYGRITKLVVNKNNLYNSNGPNGPSYTCFITYSNEAESSLAILSLDNSIIDSHEIKANYGTTKYCLNFLKNYECKNKDCIYLHHLADKKDIVSREQMNTDKDLFPLQRLMAIELSKILTNIKYQELYKLKDKKTIFPNCFSVYKKEIVIRYIKEKNLGISLNLNSPQLTFESKQNQKMPKNNNYNKEENEKNEEIKKDKLIPQLNIKTLLNNLIQNQQTFEHLYKIAPKSRFNFVNESEISQIIPSQIDYFLRQRFIRHSKYYEEEQKNFTYEYFENYDKYPDSDDSYSSLISCLNIFNNEENNLAKKAETY